MSLINTEISELDKILTINDHYKKQLSAKGHVLLRNVLSESETASWKVSIENAVNKLNTEKRQMKDRDTYAKAFLQIMNLWRRDEKIKQFVLSKRLGSIAAQLLGVENVRIYHDQALFKEPKGGPTPWHQDQYYWPIDTDKTITMWMPLVDVDEDMGMLSFASGSHTKGCVFDFEISDESEQEYDRYVKEQQFEIYRPNSMKAGDASWHYGYTIHNAPGNLSDKMRQIMTIIYVADGSRVATPKNNWQENDRKAWLMDKPAGQLIDSELNPLLL